MDDDDILHRFGTVLEPIKEDEAPAKKPIMIEDQIVTDENGKRRFHGAFTGGFSAGFWNTVGSLEGWTPQSYKSSRSEKAPQRQKQYVEDFMDQEDLGQFGIAPQVICTREEFFINDASDLEQLLKPVKDKSAVKILKNMSWKPGHGIGPQKMQKEKHQTMQRNHQELYLRKHYGCTEDDGLKSKINVVETKIGDAYGDNNYDNNEISFASDDYEPFFSHVKINRFGLSYSGLDQAPHYSSHVEMPRSQHLNVFTSVEVFNKRKKLAISGQAFGVGALEKDDEDIYARDSMSRYDFSLAYSRPNQKKYSKYVQDYHIIDGYVEDKVVACFNYIYSIDLPREFVPRNWSVRRSRFDLLKAGNTKPYPSDNKLKKMVLGRHALNLEQRVQLLDEEVKFPNKETHSAKVSSSKIKEQKSGNILEQINATCYNFTRCDIITGGCKKTNELDQEKNILPYKESNKTIVSATGTFKPFLYDAAKQTRYELFLSSKLVDDHEITNFLNNIQPIKHTSWDREIEKREFIQARNIYKPLSGVMSERFVSESVVETAKIEGAVGPDEQKKNIVERTRCTWKPAAQLCKRYNIILPFDGTMVTAQPIAKRAKLSIFGYLECSINSKVNFQVPTIIPKPIVKPALVAVVKGRRIVESTVETPTDTSIESKVCDTIRGTAILEKVTKCRTKTELEIQVDKDKPISEKTELFKSIFEDSDDDPHNYEVINSKIIPGIVGNIEQLTAQLNLPATIKPASAVTTRLLRNNSQPKGIFAALLQQPLKQTDDVENLKTYITEAVLDETLSKDSLPLQRNKLIEEPKITFKSKTERLAGVNDGLKLNLYGPKLPNHILSGKRNSASGNNFTTTDEIDKKLLKLIMEEKSTKRGNSHLQIMWVEKRSDVGNIKNEATRGKSCASSGDNDNDRHKRKATNTRKDAHKIKNNTKNQKIKSNKLKKSNAK